MANLPYIVSGTITDTDATNPNGAKVVLRNDTNGESINKLTNSSGQYVMDAANLSSGYLQTDRLTVICAFGNADAEDSFLISDDTHTVDLTLTTVSESSDLTYAQVQDVLDELGDKTTSDISFNRVRKSILRAEREIDDRSNTKFSSTTVSNEIYDVNQYTFYKSPSQLTTFSTQILVGTRNDSFSTFFDDQFKLNKNPILTITTLEVNDAGPSDTDSWRTLTENTGSGGDFLVNLDIGLITFVNNKPSQGQRKVRVSYTYGFSTVPADVERLCILLAIKSIITSSTTSSQFEGTDGFSIPDLSISKGISGGISYLEDLRAEIKDLWAIIGDMVTNVA